MTRRQPKRGRKTSVRLRKNDPTSGEYTYTPDPATYSAGQRRAVTHRLSVTPCLDHTPVPGERYAAMDRLALALNTQAAAALCETLTAAEDSGDIEREAAALRQLLAHINNLLPIGWEGVVGDAPLFTRPR